MKQCKILCFSTKYFLIYSLKSLDYTKGEKNFGKYLEMSGNTSKYGKDTMKQLNSTV